MKNKTILLGIGILAILVIIFLFCGSFFSCKEGMDADYEKMKETIIGYIQSRKTPDNPKGTLTDDNIIESIFTLGYSNPIITNVFQSMTSSKDGVDKFAQLFGQGVYDPLEDSLVIHYTFKDIFYGDEDNKPRIRNMSRNNLGASPSAYDATIHQHSTNTQAINTIIDTKNSAVNPSCLFLSGLPRTDSITGGSSDNGAYLMIPKLPTFHSNGFLGMSFSVWFCATDKNGNWARVFDFGNNSGSDNILVSPSENGTQNLACLIIGNGDSNWVQYNGDYVSDSNWRHLVWTVAKDGSWIIYVNNRIVSNKQHKCIPRDIERSLNYIGKSNWNSTSDSRYTGDDMYNGWIDDLRIYQRELTPEEVNMLYAKGGKVQQKNNKVWVMEDTKDKWYLNNRVFIDMGGLTSDLGIMSNTQMTIAFWLNVDGNHDSWRSVFLMGNHGPTDNAITGARIPSLYIYPNSNWYRDSANLHLRFGTTLGGWNDGLKPDGDPDIRFPLGKDIHITFTFNGKTIKYYQNGIEKYSRTLNNNNRFVNNNSNTRLYMNPWTDNRGVKIKNFQIFNRSLLPDEVMTVYSQIYCMY